tara:strand:+ start:984 stop:1784 length:801 start_codon:yes stop_codon:yes gene_type:complete
MLRSFAGIMADEEPKTPVSSSGLYNSSEWSNGFPLYYLSQPSLSGLDEFSIMVWLRIDMSDNLFIQNFSFLPYREIGGVNIIPFIISNTNIYCAISNSNGGTNLIDHDLTSIDNHEWFHFTLTGSVLNNRMRLYKDGVLLTSSVMTYGSESGSTSSYIDIKAFLSMSQLNIFNRELTQEEVSQHYVGDAEVLGFDAMTPAQKSGLVYSSSLTKDISISGNEFSDRSGNGISMSPQPNLTGEQIYVYTDANDLPPENKLGAKLGAKL